MLLHAYPSPRDIHIGSKIACGADGSRECGDPSAPHKPSVAATAMPLRVLPPRRGCQRRAAAYLTAVEAIEAAADAAAAAWRGGICPPRPGATAAAQHYHYGCDTQAAFARAPRKRRARTEFPPPCPTRSLAGLQARRGCFGRPFSLPPKMGGRPAAASPVTAGVASGGCRRCRRRPVGEWRHAAGRQYDAAFPAPWGRRTSCRKRRSPAHHRLSAESMIRKDGLASPGQTCYKLRDEIETTPCGYPQ